jgi:enoyl-CoA hydratase
MTRGSEKEGAVHLLIDGAIAKLIFDRPAARNAMTWAMYEQLAEGLRTIEADPAVRVAVLRGQGGQAFVAGTDIAQFTAFKSGDDGVAYERRIDRYVEALERVRVPTIAVVDGMAVGGGLAIANACDFRLATPGAKFGVPIARTLGNCLSPANLRRLTATLGPSRVKKMLLLAEMLPAESLAATAYVTIVPDADMEGEIERMCRRLLEHAPLSMQATKIMLHRLASDPTTDAADLIAACYGSDDFAIGVRAFLAKQRPEWTGK